MSASDQQIGGSHYKRYLIQPAKFAHANGLGFLESCVIKRLCRFREKGRYEDLLKAAHEIALLAEFEYGRAIHVRSDQSEFERRGQGL